MCRISVRTLIYCGKSQQPLDIISLAPSCDFSHCFHPNSSNNNTAPAARGKWVLTCTPLYVPCHSDMVLFHWPWPLTGCHQKHGLPNCPSSKDHWNIYLQTFPQTTVNKQCISFNPCPKEPPLISSVVQYCLTLSFHSDPINLLHLGQDHLGTYCFRLGGVNTNLTHVLLCCPGWFTSGQSTTTYLTPGQAAVAGRYWNHTAITD